MTDEAVVADAEAVVYGEAHAFYSEHPELVILHQLTDTVISLCRNIRARYEAMPPTEQKEVLYVILRAVLGRE